MKSQTSLINIFDILICTYRLRLRLLRNVRKEVRKTSKPTRIGKILKKKKRKEKKRIRSLLITKF